MIPFLHFKGYRAADPLDALHPKRRRWAIVLPALLISTLFVVGGMHLGVVSAPPFRWLCLAALLFAVTCLHGFVFRKNASHVVWLTVLAALFLAGTMLLGGGSPMPGFLVKWLGGSLVTALVAGPLALWFMRLLASILPHENVPTEATPGQYEALFPPEWTQEAVPIRQRDFMRVLLRGLAVFYGLYLAALVAGGFMQSAVTGPLKDWLNLNYTNPALAAITFAKLSLMFYLANAAAYNKGLRHVAGWLLAGGHLVSVVGSLALYFLTADDQYRNFLLLSAAADSVVAAVGIWAALRHRADREAYSLPPSFPDFYSVPQRIMRYFLLAAAGLCFLAVCLVGLSRALPAYFGAAGVIFSGPDPLVVNALTRFATTGVLYFLISKNERLREALAHIVLGVNAISIIAQLTLLLTATSHQNFLLALAFMDVLVFASFSRLRIMFYRVEYGISYFSGFSAQGILSFHQAVFSEDGADGAAMLKSLDAYAGGIRGRKRGLLNFPFLLLETLTPALYLRSSFSAMSLEERRYFLQKKLMRLPRERKAAPMPVVADLTYTLALISHGLISMAHYDQPKNKSKIGYVPTDARDRLQGITPSARPPFDQVAALPTSYLDPQNYRPPAPAPKPNDPPVRPLSLRIATPINEPDLPDAVDYLVVGSGAGGAVMAYRLACTVDKPGEILVVDRGLRYAPLQDFSESELEMYMKLYKEGGLQTTKRFDITIIQGECVGGSTVVNNAICLRMPDLVRQRWQNEFGLDMSQLTAAYDQVQKELGIQQIPELALNERVEKLFRSGVDAYNLPRPLEEQLEYRLLESNHYQPGGDGLDNLGNRRLPKRSMLESYIPWSEARGVQVVGGYTAACFEAAGRRVQRVLLRSNTGNLKWVKVRKGLVVSCGAIASSHLLMRSKVQRPVGRYLGCNFALPFNFHFLQELKAFDGLQIGLAAMAPGHPAAFETYFNPPALFSISLPFFFGRQQRAMSAYSNLLSLGSLIGSEPNGVIRPEADWINGRAVDWKLGEADVKNMRYSFEHLVRLAKDCGADRGYLPLIPGVELPLDEASLQRYVKAVSDFPLSQKTVRLNTAHPQGGNRACGDGSPHRQGRTLDGKFRVDGYDNVFVADASVFPTSITVNPQWTIWALSTMAAVHVADLE